MAMVLGGETSARDGESRVLAYAVLASIVLHGALLFANLHLRSNAKKVNPAPGPIVARLAAPPPAAEPAPATPPEPVAKPRVEEPPPPVARPQPAPAAKAAPKAPVVPATSAPTAPPSEAAKPVPEAPPPAAPSAPPPGPVAKVDPQPAPPTAPAEAADTGSLDKYRIDIYSAAKRYKKYPRVALDNNWEGKAVIHMVIGANGMIASISIKTSTGHEALDQSALETLRKAKPLVPIPAALRGKEFGLDINFVFNLKDENA